MNSNGESGNVIALARRCAWRGFAVRVSALGIGEALDAEEHDLFFIGGGPEHETELAREDLAGEKGDALRHAVEEGAVLLSVCGGYQLLGRSYPARGGGESPGISLFDARTVGGDARFVGGVAAECCLEGARGTLVGFENHSARTYLGPACRPLAKVFRGCGNNGEDGYEGCVYRNAVGTYLHGPLLPANPRLADWLILRALQRRHGIASLAPLDDALEEAAHRDALRLARRERGRRRLPGGRQGQASRFGGPKASPPGR